MAKRIAVSAETSATITKAKAIKAKRTNDFIDREAEKRSDSPTPPAGQNYKPPAPCGGQPPQLSGAGEANPERRDRRRVCDATTAVRPGARGPTGLPTVSTTYER